MNMKLSFSWIGIAVFALPMLINIAYAVFPPALEYASAKSTARWLETVESISRILYLVLLTFLVSEKTLDVRSIWFAAAVVFLILYYIVWIRYFFGGRDVALLGKPFLFVPIPLAIFPVLYYLFAAVWMDNIPAVITMLIFGAAHVTVSVQSFQ